MALSSRFFAALLALLLALGVAMQASAQAEPTLDQIYKAANAGQMARANEMADQVLKTHPASAKAHYVKAELAAHERNFTLARDELARAESLAPGLPFVKSESLQALRGQIAQAGRAAAPAQAQPQARVAPAAPAAPAASGFSIPWGALIIGGAVIAVVFAMRRRSAANSAAAAAAPMAYGGQPGTMPGPGYGPQPGDGPQPGYGPQPYGQQPSMGGSVMRGLGAGLAVGAGALAAQEIGRRMFSHDDPHTAAGVPPDVYGNQAADLNREMGGTDFGIDNGSGSWDDAGGGIGGGGNDWDT